jgi:hypothetical protein
MHRGSWIQEYKIDTLHTAVIQLSNFIFIIINFALAYGREEKKAKAGLAEDKGSCR